MVYVGMVRSRRLPQTVFDPFQDYSGIEREGWVKPWGRRGEGFKSEGEDMKGMGRWG
jgi:hypothetical protein